MCNLKIFKYFFVLFGFNVICHSIIAAAADEDLLVTQIVDWSSEKFNKNGYQYRCRSKISLPSALRIASLVKQEKIELAEIRDLYRITCEINISEQVAQMSRDAIDYVKKVYNFSSLSFGASVDIAKEIDRASRAGNFDASVFWDLVSVTNSHSFSLKAAKNRKLGDTVLDILNFGLYSAKEKYQRKAKCSKIIPTDALSIATAVLENRMDLQAFKLAYYNSCDLFLSMNSATVQGKSALPSAPAANVEPAAPAVQLAE